MIAINYEERYIFMLLASVINQTQIKVLRKRVDWEAILKISDFQDIITPIYYGILGLEKDASEECIDKFYQKYRKQLLLEEAYTKSEKTIRWQLDRHGISALWLTGTKMYSYFQQSELGYISALEIMVRHKDLVYVHRLMREMDYEQKENRIGKGILYTRVPGIRVIFYDEIPLSNKVLKEHLSEPIRKHRNIEGYQHIYGLNLEDEYVYRYGRLAEAYITGNLTIRKMINMYQYEGVLDDRIQRENLLELWRKAKVLEFVEQAGVLLRLWFGESENEDCGTAIELEEYILSQKEDRWLDEKLLPQERIWLDFYRRDREQEWSLKKKQWWFPSKKYMVGFFPVLNKMPFLLGVCWIVRLLRYAKYVSSCRLKEIFLKMGTKWLDIKEKWKERVAKKNLEEVVEEENTSEEGLETEDTSEVIPEEESPLEEGRNEE